MKRVSINICLVLSLLSGAATRPSHADIAANCNLNDPQQFCSPSFNLSGNGLSPIGGYSASATSSVDYPRMPVGGVLSYNDQAIIESIAWNNLDVAKRFRQRISPYQTNPANQQDFEVLVRQFFTATNPLDAFDRIVPLLPNELVTMTLRDKLNAVESSLRYARDTYAYLAIYGNHTRFRSDLGSQCAVGATVNRCDFARMAREVIREAAYLRLIFGQQLTADSIGLFFGANVVGGEGYIQTELRKLEEGVRQYQLAQQTFLDGMNVSLGSDCYGQDFFTDREWLVYSRIVEGLRRAQQQIAQRKAQLNEGALLQSVDWYRTTGAEQYVQLIGAAGLQARLKRNPCGAGYQIKDEVIRKMAADLVDTRKDAKASFEFMNILGFDARLIPALKFEDIYAAARSQTNTAKEDERNVREEKRAAEHNTILLNDKIDSTRKSFDASLKSWTGCADTNLVACARHYPTILRNCLLTSTVDKLLSEESFTNCLSANGIANERGELHVLAERIRNAARAVLLANTKLDNIQKSKEYEQERLAKVTDAIYGSVPSTLEAIGTSIALDTAGAAQSVGGGYLTGQLNASPQVLLSEQKSAIARPQFIEFIIVGAIILGGAAAKGAIGRGAQNREAAARASIEAVNSEATVKNLLLRMAELQIEEGIAIQEARVIYSEFDALASKVDDVLIERERTANYTLALLADEPANRLVYDSLRLKYANSMSLAQRMVYLTVRRAEYETAGKIYEANCLNGAVTGQRITIAHVYHARTTGDLGELLDCISAITTAAKGDSNATLKPDDLRISVAKNLLGWTDESLIKEGIPSNQVATERIKRFRAWVASNVSGNPSVLRFNFSTSIAPNGVFGQLRAGYSKYWLHQIAGYHDPLPVNDALRMTIATTQTASLAYRDVTLTQQGVTHLRDETGCIREFKVVDPAIFVGLNLGREENRATFEAAVNAEPQPGYYTPHFNGRPISATDWQVEIPSAPPNASYATMDFAWLTDIELRISTTRRATDAQVADPLVCLR